MAAIEGNHNPDQRETLEENSSGSHLFFKRLALLRAIFNEPGLPRYSSDLPVENNGSNNVANTKELIDIYLELE